MNRKALGRGLGALLSSDRTIDLGSEPSEVDIDSIVPGPMPPIFAGRLSASHLSVSVIPLALVKAHEKWSAVGAPR